MGHSKNYSPCGHFSAKEIVEKYKAKGYDGVVLSNHFFINDKYLIDKKGYGDFFLEGYLEFQEECKKAGIVPYLGMEIRFNKISNNDFLLYGINKDDIYGALEYLDKDLETFYKEFKRDDILIFQAHPYRNGCTPEKPDFLDGAEAFNMHPGHNNRPPRAVKFAKENNLLICGGSDFHEEGREAMIATCTKTLPENEKELFEILKAQDFILNMQGSIIIP